MAPDCSVVMAVLALFVVVAVMYDISRDINREMMLERSQETITTFHRAEIPSASPRRSAAPLDLLPARSEPHPDSLTGYISSSEYLKTLLPDTGTVCITVALDYYKIWVQDWHQRMTKLGCPAVVIAGDESTFFFAKRRGVPVFLSRPSYAESIHLVATEHFSDKAFRVGYAKFQAMHLILQLGRDVVLSEMDVFWRTSPLDEISHIRDAALHDLYVSFHSGHPRVNIGVAYAKSTPETIEFFSELRFFYSRFGVPAFVADQRIFDAFLNNYDKIEKVYLDAWKSLGHRVFPPVKWRKWEENKGYDHVMTDGDGFSLYERHALAGKRSAEYYSGPFFQVEFANASDSFETRFLEQRHAMILAKVLGRKALWQTRLRVAGKDYDPAELFDFVHLASVDLLPHYSVRPSRDTQIIDLTGRRVITDRIIRSRADRHREVWIVRVDPGVQINLEEIDDPRLYELQWLEHYGVQGCDPFYANNPMDKMGFDRRGAQPNPGFCRTDWRRNYIMTDLMFACSDYEAKCTSKTDFIRKNGGYLTEGRVHVIERGE